MGEGFGAEEDPADQHHDHRVKPTQSRRQDLQHPSPASAFERQEKPVPESPENERPAGAMPEATQDEHREQVEDSACVALAVATQRYVQVIAKPRRQRQMPAPPELLNGGSNIGIVEVFQEFEPEHPA